MSTLLPLPRTCFLHRPLLKGRPQNTHTNRVVICQLVNEITSQCLFALRIIWQPKHRHFQNRFCLLYLFSLLFDHLWPRILSIDQLLFQYNLLKTWLDYKITSDESSIQPTSTLCLHLHLAYYNFKKVCAYQASINVCTISPCFYFVLVNPLRFFLKKKCTQNRHSALTSTEIHSSGSNSRWATQSASWIFL